MGQPTDLSPFKSKRVDHRLDPVQEPMRLFGYLNPTFPFGPLGAVENKDGKDWLRKEFRQAEKDESQLWVFAFPSTLGMEEPYTGERTHATL